MIRMLRSPSLGRLENVVSHESSKKSIRYLHLGLAIRNSDEFLSLELLSFWIEFSKCSLLVGRLAISTSHFLLGSIGDLMNPK